ncbi:MAG TPA: glycosyl hydrolase family 65 protein [Acidimicrobiales bacterium]|nr:glycosyl hydrolase family 65 protein [Acidimicrobiales bacterium]
MPPGLDRRFEAVVMWMVGPQNVARAAVPLKALARAGALVGVIAPLTVEELIRQLGWPEAGTADLLLADSSGSGAVVVDETGVHHMATSTRSVAPSAEDGAEKAGVGKLAGLGLTPIAQPRIDGIPRIVSTLDELWRRGVDSRDVLLLIDRSPGEPQGAAPVFIPDIPYIADIAEMTALQIVVFAGETADLHWLLADQRRRRRQRSLPEVAIRTGWSLVVSGRDVQHERVDEALLTLADGHVGTSGAPLAPDPSQRPWVVAAGVYDGEGAGTHLLTGPRVFELSGLVDGFGPLRRVLDLRTGVLHELSSTNRGLVESVRFASLAQPTTSVLRVRCPKGLRTGPPLLPPADDCIHDHGRSGAVSWIRIAASKGGIAAAATQTRTRGGAGSTLDRFAVYRSGTETVPDPNPVVDLLDRAANVGFDKHLLRHRRAWARRWEDADVVVEGDDELQLAIRVALFHLMASVADEGEAAVGARGLTGTGYRGHVFWDADTFVLPFLAATHPASARAMLEYRLRRLPAAVGAARAAGRAGARFPWESARTGRDVTPTSARDRAGQIVPIRTGQLEEHIVADIAWAACCYVDWSGDEEFASGPGRRILVQTARYWESRITLESNGSAHIYGVIGPDEYHESVDDNAFTNVMARWNLRRAAEAADTANSANSDGADGADGADIDERRRWLQLADDLVDGYDPDTGIYEQFAGFGQLEPLIIKEFAPRRPIAADLLLGAERVAGAQVIKQADVLLLHHLVPDEVVAGSLGPNLCYYEPRTAHGSSLSPATHASLQARARDFDQALESLHLAARMDLDDLTGSTAGGLHLATMGGLWQALAFGFAGLRPKAGMLHVDPALPPSWTALEMRVRFRGSRVRVRKERAHLTIDTDRSTSVVVSGTPFSAGPGKLEFRRRGACWEPIT